MDYKRLGKNIKALRMAYGETQEQLAEYLGLETKSAVSNYESGSREPDKQMLDKIAKHYLTPVDVLLYSDLSELDKIKVGEKIFWNYIDFIFPIIASDEAMENQSFAAAYNMHEQIYEKARKVTWNTIQDDDGVFDSMVNCMDDYEEALEDEKSQVYAAANCLACLLLTLMLIKATPSILQNRPALFMQLFNNNDKFRRVINNMSEGYTEDMKKAEELFTGEEIDSEINKLIKILKSSQDLVDLAYYYIALRYVFNVVENDMSMEWNQTLGHEMMFSFLSIENIYAARFIVASNELSGASSQHVNE